ncbi:hypothetical protein JCM1393_25530 [Clostridium carnis]
MQNTSTAYKTEIKKTSRSFECRITIGERVFTNEEVENIELNGGIQEVFSIGNTPSMCLDLVLRNTTDTIFNTNQIKVEVGLKINNSIEYVPLGIFNIENVKKDDFTTKFTCYDNMVKFKTPYFSKLGDASTLQQIVNELVEFTGVQFIGSLPTYNNLKKLEGFTCREVLGFIASICGGNALITRDGKFTIIYPTDVQRDIGEGVFDLQRDEVEYKIGKISCQVGEEILSKGNLGIDSMELQFKNPWVNQAILTDIYNRLNGFSYLGYTIKWQGDLSLDVGDIITYTDVEGITRKLPILNTKLSYDGGLDSELKAKGETKNKNSFDQNGSMANKINRVVTELLIANEALINKANIEDLNVIDAKIQNLIAMDATINKALINKADITDTNIINAKIKVLEAESSTLKTILNGNLSSENIQTGGITGDKLNMNTIFVKDANMVNVNISALKAGDISTNKFRIVSENGGIEIVGATQQFKDKNNRVRIQMGQDTKGNFNFILRGEDGTTTLIDHTGIKEKAIANDLIKESMIASNSIGEKQINYSSLITGFNKDTNTQRILASKVAIDLTGQTLDVSFNSLKTEVQNINISDKNLCEKDCIEAFLTKIYINKYSYTFDAGDSWEGKGIKILGRIFKPSSNYVIRFFIKKNSGNLNCIGGHSILFLKQKLYIDDVLQNNNYDTPGVNLPNDENLHKVVIYARTKDILEGDYNLYIQPNRRNYNSACNVTISNIKVEEDIEQAVLDVKEITTSNSTSINVMQGQISTAINNTQITRDGQIVLLKDDYNRTVVKVDSINSTIGSHSSSLDQLTGKITGVETRVNSVERDLIGTKSTVSSNSTQINNLNSTVNNQVASITQLLNKIDLKVDQTQVTNTVNSAIDAMQIGGRNLAKNDNIVAHHTSFTKSGNKYSWSSSYLNFGLKLTSNMLIPGKKYVLSYKIRKLSGTINFVGGHCSHDNVKTYLNGAPTNNYVSGIPYPENSLAQEIRVSFIANNTSDRNVYIQIGRGASIATEYTVEVWDIQMEEGDKQTSYVTPLEDVDQAINEVNIKVELVKSNVANITLDLNSITSKVSSVEQTTTTINNNLNSLNSRMSTAEQKITDNAIISTVQATINTAKQEAINSANSSTDSKLNNYATTSALNSAITQQANNIKLEVSNTFLSKNDASGIYATKASMDLTSTQLKLDFSQSGGYNLLRNGQFLKDTTGFWTHEYVWNGQNKSVSLIGSNSNWCLDGRNTLQIRGQWATQGEYGLAQSVTLKRNTTYTLSGYQAGHRAKGYVHIQRNGGDWKIFGSANLNETNGGKSDTNWNKFSITFTTDGELNVYNMHFKIGRCDNDGYVWYTDLTLTEGAASRKYTPHPDEIYSGNTIIDRDGVTIRNGALTVLNNAGQIMLQGDSNGNLSFQGRLQPHDHILKLFGDDCRIDGANGFIRLQCNKENYLSVQPNQFDFYASNFNKATFEYKDRHFFIRGNRTGDCGAIKLLGASGDVQCRTGDDGGYSRLICSAVVQTSRREYKENIEETNNINFKDILMKNEIKTYNYKRENYSIIKDSEGEYIETKSQALGFILEDMTEDARRYLNPLNSDGIDLYAMISVLWKICQDYQKRIDVLEAAK